MIDGGTAADLAGVFTDGGGLATSIAATALSQVAQGDTNQAQALTDYTQGNSSNPGLPNCASEFTGTISADANINAAQGISADNGAITLGDTNGTTFSQGITLGGGALSGAGTGGLEAFTGDVTSIAIRKLVPAQIRPTTGSDDTALGTSATADDTKFDRRWRQFGGVHQRPAVGEASTASNGGVAIGLGAQATGTSFSIAVETRQSKSTR